MLGSGDALNLYVTRHRADRLISTASAESIANQSIKARKGERQQTRWTPGGAHPLAQVRCAAINGDLARRFQADEAENAGDIAAETDRFLDLLQRAAA